MSQAVDLLAREAEVIRILKVLSSESNKFVVIGGYAINALTSHRFSVDCDIVVDFKGMKEISTILDREGYKASKIEKQPIYGVKMKRFLKPAGFSKVSVEVFPKEVSCRQTEGSWSYEQIIENSSKRTSVGLTDSAEAMVPKKELIMAMKIHAGRDTDLRDVTMLSERADWESIANFASCGDLDKVKVQIESALQIISKPQFASSLKAEFGLRSDVSPPIRRTIEGLKKVRDSFKEESM
jgi:hypothetical protein